jgi:hypothetical protein
VYRILAEADADRYNSLLADSLSDLAATLSALDRQAEAATARTEAAQLRAH